MIENPKDNIENIKEKIENMSNKELGYKLAEWLMQGYHTGGHSADRSLRSTIVRLFFNLNEDSNNKNITINNNYDLILEIANSRDKNIEKTNSMLLDDVDINNKKIISIILLKKLVEDYKYNLDKNMDLEKRRDNGEDVSLNDIDYSFNREIANVKLIYDLYLTDIDLSDKDIEILSQKYPFEELRQKVDYEFDELR